MRAVTVLGEIWEIASAQVRSFVLDRGFVGVAAGSGDSGLPATPSSMVTTVAQPMNATPVTAVRPAERRRGQPFAPDADGFGLGSGECCGPADVLLGPPGARPGCQADDHHPGNRPGGADQAA